MSVTTNPTAKIDTQGVVAIIVVGGTVAVAVTALMKNADPSQILGVMTPLAAAVVGFFFGVKSQQ
jgi:hypothetical protein